MERAETFNYPIIPELTAQEWMLYPLISGMASFNAFNAPAVANSLLDNRLLWSTCMLGLTAITLRDLDRVLNVGTLYLTPRFGQDVALEQLVDTWDADEVDWYGKGKPSSLKQLGSGLYLAECGVEPVLRVWWD